MTDDKDDPDKYKLKLYIKADPDSNASTELDAAVNLKVQDCLAKVHHVCCTKVQLLLKSLEYQGISLFLEAISRFSFRCNFLSDFLVLQDSNPRILIEYGIVSYRFIRHNNTRSNGLWIPMLRVFVFYCCPVRQNGVYIGFSGSNTEKRSGLS